MQLPLCVYSDNPDIQNIWDQLRKVLEGRIDGHNVDFDKLLGRGLLKQEYDPNDPDPENGPWIVNELTPLPPNPPRPLPPAPVPGPLGPGVRLKLKDDVTGVDTAVGLELLVRAAHADGMVCIVDSEDTQEPKRQILSFKPEDSSGSNPGALSKANYGTYTIDTGGNFDVLVKRNGTTKMTVGASATTHAQQVTWAASLPGPQILGPTGAALIIYAASGSPLAIGESAGAGQSLTFSSANDGPTFVASDKLGVENTDEFVGYLDFSALTDGREYDMPNASGTIALTSDLAAYQPLDATLTALAGLATGADKVPYSTGSDTFSQYAIGTASAATKVPVADGSGKLAKEWMPSTASTPVPDITNSIGSGGTANTVSPLTGLVYVDDVSTISGNFNRIAEKLDQIIDALRLFNVPAS